MQLRGFDPELAEHLEVHLRINPQFFAFRWITLLLTQEFRRERGGCVRVRGGGGGAGVGGGG